MAVRSSAFRTRTGTPGQCRKSKPGPGSHSFRRTTPVSANGPVADPPGDTSLFAVTRTWPDGNRTLQGADAEASLSRGRPPAPSPDRARDRDRRLGASRNWVGSRGPRGRRCRDGRRLVIAAAMVGLDGVQLCAGGLGAPVASVKPTT